MIKFDKSKYYLGSICTRAHNWNNSGKSLRYKSDYKCIECVKIKSHIKYERTKELRKQKKIDEIKKYDGLYDSNIFHLGSLCKKGHDWNNSGKSLRYNINNICINCKKEKDKIQKEFSYKYDYSNNKFYLGILCRRNHNFKNSGKSLRYKNGSNKNSCLECVRENRKQKRENNKEKIRIKSQEYYKKNKVKISEKSKEYRAGNKDKIKGIQRKYYLKNREREIQKSIKRIKEREQNDPGFRLHRRMSKSIHSAIKYKKGRSWESLVGYTTEELKEHLETQFKKGMAWDNYGKKWHIDHIIPRSKFNYIYYDDIDFKRCWALTNLQPLWAKENIQKSDKVDKDFQPFLSFS